MKDQEILERIEQVLMEEFEIEADAVRLEASLYEDLDIDSIDAVDLIVRLKELSGERIPPDQFKNVRTIGDIVEVVSNAIR